MGEFFRFFCANMERALKNKTFFLAAAGVAILEIMDIAPFVLWNAVIEDGEIKLTANLVYLISMEGGTTLYNLLAITLCVLPFVSCFCDDYDNHFLTMIFGRCSMKKYALSTMAVCGVSSFLCMVLGQTLYMLAASCIMPISDDISFYEGSYQSLEQGHFMVYILFHIILRGLRGSFFAMFALMISAYVKNKFFVAASPTIIYFLLLYIMTDLPAKIGMEGLNRINIWNIYFTFQFGLDREGFSLWVSFLYTVIVGGLWCFIYYIGIRRCCK